MTRLEIESTDWAAKISRDRPQDYEYAIRAAMTPGLPVQIYHSPVLGNWRWIIEDDENFILSDHPDKNEAYWTCREFDWLPAAIGASNERYRTDIKNKPPRSKKA